MMAWSNKHEDQVPHPSEHLDFDTVHHDIDNISRPHPSEPLEFSTAPAHIVGHGGSEPHPSEALEFATVHDSLRVGRGATFGSPQTRSTHAQETPWTFKEALSKTAVGNDDDGRGSRHSSMTFFPTAPKHDARYLEYAHLTPSVRARQERG